MDKLKKPLTLAVARIGENALVPAGDTQYQLYEQNAMNAPLDMIVDLIVEVMNKKLEQFYPEFPIHVLAPRYLDTKTRVAERQIQANPANLVTPELKNELMTTVMTVVEGMIPTAGTILSGPTVPTLAPDKADFVQEQISNQIQKYNGRKIQKPGVLVLSLPGQKTLEIPVQGSFTPPVVQHRKNNPDVEILAQPDGLMRSKMQIFLRPVNESDQTVGSKSITYIAEKPSQLQLAAEACLDNRLLLKALIREDTSSDGKKKLLIKELQTVSLDTLSQEGGLEL